MGKTAPMYDIFLSRGRGLEEGPRFLRLIDALRYITQRRAEASFAVREPTGSWYEWPAVSGAILPRRERRPSQRPSL